MHDHDQTPLFALEFRRELDFFDLKKRDFSGEFLVLRQLHCRSSSELDAINVFLGVRVYAMRDSNCARVHKCQNACSPFLAGVGSEWRGFLPAADAPLQ